MESLYSDTIVLDDYSSAFESSQEEGFREECFEVLNEFNNIQQLLLVENTERSEIIEHKMATVTHYKDLFRVQLDKLLHNLLSQEINKLPDGSDKQILLDVSLDNIKDFLENDIYLDGTSISNELKNIILNILKKINFIVANWEFLSDKSEDFEMYSIDSIRSEIEFMLTDNVSTFLGENIKLAETFFEETAKSGKFSTQELVDLNSLIKENGFRKVEFNYELDFEKIKYLIYSAIRCRTQLSNEREDVELFNLIVILITSFRNNPGFNKIVQDVKTIYKDKAEVLVQLESLVNSDLKPRLIIENSPPIYSNVQHNLMLRIYESIDNGVKVHIFSLPYNQLESEDSLNLGEQLKTYPVSGNEIENNILSTLITSDLQVEDVVSQHPTLKKYNLETIRNNDSVLDPIIDDLVDNLHPFVSKVTGKLPQIISDPVLRAQYVKTYEDTIRAIELSLKDKSKIKTNLTEEQLAEVQEEIVERVMSGQSLESAVHEIAGNKAEIESNSDGDCVTFETKIESEDGKVTEDFSRFENGTVLTSKEVEGNGFKSEIIEMVMDGKKINMVKCLVCQKQFDTCNEACPECKTERSKQYDAIYNGKTKEGKAAIKEINHLIEQRKAQAREELESQVVKEVMRAKGFINFANAPLKDESGNVRKYLLQYVLSRKDYTFSEWENNEPRLSALLILGKGLNKKEILDALKSTEASKKSFLGALKDRVKHELNT